MATISLPDLVVRVIDGWQAGGSRFLLGIAGPPAAGKSTLAVNLRDEINTKHGRPVAEIAPMDGFHLPNATLDAMGLRALKGAPQTFDAIGYVAALRSLRRRPPATVGWPAYDRVVRHEPVADAIPIGPEIGVVITEGNYLLLPEQPWAQVRELLDQTWYLDVDRAVILDRLRRRHLATGRSERQTEVKIAETDLPNSALIGETKRSADLILD